MEWREHITPLPPEVQLEMADFLSSLHQDHPLHRPTAARHSRPSLLDVMARAPGKLVFISADEVATYIQAEGDA